jgi:type II secretory pathway pseudopilin PulG
MELILVMAILAMVAAIAVPRLTGFSEGREIAAEWNRLASFLRYARSQAIARAETIEVKFDEHPARYWLEGKDAPQNMADISSSSSVVNNQPTDNEHPPATAKPNSELMGEHRFPKKYTLEFPEFDDSDRREDGLVSIRFLPDGSVDDQSPKQLQLTKEDDTGFSRELEADPVLGYVVPK